MDGGRSRTSQEEDEGRRASKQLRVALQGQEKEVVTQPEPQAWLPALMFHGEPLMDNTSLRDFNKGEGTYVSSSTLSSPVKLPPTVQLADPKRKRSAKGKEPMDEGRSRTSQEEDEGR